MAKNKNQHYVPKFYFRLFSQDGKSICTLARSDGSTIEKASIKDQASKSYFYGTTEADRALSTIEQIFSSVVRKILGDGSFENCTPDDYVFLFKNITLQRARTLTARKSAKESQDKLLRLQMMVEINTNESLDEEERSSLIEEVDYFEANPQRYQIEAMVAALQSSESLRDLQPIVLRNKTRRPFVFGDAPVVFTNPLLKNVTFEGVLGFESPGLIVYYPLDSKHAIMLVDDKNYRIRGLRNTVLAVRNLTDVADLNKIQIHNAASAVYFSDYRHAHYVRGLWKQERTRFRNPNDRIIEAPGFYEDGTPMGDIICHFEPQLPFIPKLSFLVCREVPTKEYVSSRRGRYV